MNSKYERHLLWNLRQKKSQNYAVLRLKSAERFRRRTHTMRLKTKMQNGNGLIQNLMKKALETN
jgi:hypothetical protein